MAATAKDVFVLGRLWGWSAWLAVITSAQSTVPDDIATVSGHIRSPDGWFQTRILDKAVPRLKITYAMSFPAEKCCPEIYVSGDLPNTSGHWPGSRDCFTWDCPIEDSYDQPHICLETRPATLSKMSACVVMNGRHECVGHRTLMSVEKRVWGMFIGYQCGHNISLDLEYSVSVDVNVQAHCEPNAATTCRPISGSQTTFPNLLGQSDQKTSIPLYRSFDIMRLNRCYQHHENFTCLAMFHGCRDGQPYVPCRKMCQDFHDGCRLVKFLLKDQIRCDNFPATLNQSVCLYQPVICPIPRKPISGSVAYNTTSLHAIAYYDCDEGFDLTGETTRRCLHSGNWSATIPLCEMPKTDLKWKFPRYAIAITCLLLVSCVLLGGGCYFRREISLLVRYYCSRCKPTSGSEAETVQRRKIFLTHSNVDRDEVERFAPQLERHLPECTVITYEHDFMPGRPIVDCVMEGVWASDAVVVFLSQNYVDSEWCDFEFKEACRRMAREASFRLVILVNGEGDGVKNLKRIPVKLKTYLRTHIYLCTSEPHLWRKLRVSILK